jgi:hypothetical protein
MVSPSAYGRQGLSTMFTYALYVVCSRSCKDASDLKLRSGLDRLARATYHYNGIGTHSGAPPKASSFAQAN